MRRYYSPKNHINNNILRSIFLPYIKFETTRYYKKHLNIMCNLGIEYIHLENTQVNPLDNTIYATTFNVYPYMDMDTIVGMDRLMFGIKGTTGDIKLLHYEHIISYKQPKTNYKKSEKVYDVEIINEIIDK